MSATKCVRPILSADAQQARLKVLGLYRAFYRYIPFIVKSYDIPVNEHRCQLKLREFFYKNAAISDIRIIDMLVVKGYVTLNEMAHIWCQKHHIMYLWKPTFEPQQDTFLGQFFAGK